MNAEFLAVLDHLTREKGIDREVIIEAVEAALVSAARKALGSDVADVTVKIDRTTGAIKIFSDGQEVREAGFGRIAAQTAKQVILHKIREAERNVVYNEFSPREGTLITGTMHRFERGAIIVDLGKTEAILPKREQSPKESFRPGDRIRAYCLEVNKTAKGPQVILSRSHPSLVKELFKLEVPEIAQRIVEIKSISREAGDRSKISVTSKDEKVDCVGACVGMRGTRVKDIVRELHGEKIDIIRWSSNPEEYLTTALAPAKVAEIHLSPDKKRAEVMVEDDQLSLAIGKRGQNVRLASRLTGLDIDIRSRSQLAALTKVSIADLEGVGPKLAEALKEAGYETIAAIAQASVERLTEVKGVGEKTAKKLLEGAKEMLSKLEAELSAQNEQEQQQEQQQPPGEQGPPASAEEGS
ncbi:MAG: transcription termination/antitermination protein NusA [Candidatus Omnitrophica bacterium]|nr:transcription termination/antitermination protein NusA [Candidatus Omnitrophota bacterium]